MSSRTPRRPARARPVALALASFAPLAASGCAATPEPAPPPDVRASVGAIADELVRVAELRTDLRGLRTVIHDIHLERTGVQLAAASGRDQERLGRVLEREFLLALANRIYLIDPGESPPAGAFRPEPLPLEEVARRHGATHVLTGDYVVRGDELLLSVLLVDAETGVIVAATRGSVPMAALGVTHDLGGLVAGAPAPAAPAADGVAEAPAAGAAPDAGSTETARLAAPSHVNVVTTGRVKPREVTIVKPAWQPIGQQGANVDAGRRNVLSRAEPAAQEAPPIEDFGAWRAKKVAAGELEPDPVDPSAPAGNGRETLADPAARQAVPTTPLPLDSVPDEFPWRTDVLRKLLRVPEPQVRGFPRRYE